MPRTEEIRAVLSLQEEQGSDKPIAYFSKKLLDRETGYSTVEKEFPAIVSGLKHFEAYLLGRAFQIQRDHSALRYLSE